ncbi:MAG: PRC-barrel domain-containing protein [Rubrobacter sp.]
MEERSLIGLEARTADGGIVGRISEVVTDEESGEVTHFVVEREEEMFEVRITALTLDPDADFATFHADRSDEEPGDHVGDEEEPEGYAPGASDVEDTRHEGQLVTEPESDEEAQSEADLVREDWEDETHTPVDSGYPRTDAYIDPDSGEAEVDPAMNEGDGVGDEVGRLLDGTGLVLVSVNEGVVELSGAASRDDLSESVEEIMGLAEVREVDTTDVDVG